MVVVPELLDLPFQRSVWTAHGYHSSRNGIKIRLCNVQLVSAVPGRYVEASRVR